MIRVLLVEDQTLVCEGLEMLINVAEDMRVVSRARDGIEAIERIRETRPDLVLMDIRMPKMNGIEALRTMRAKNLTVPTILLTTFEDDAALLEGIRLGAKGYLLKDVSLAKLTESIRLVASGGSVISPVLTQRLLEEIGDAPLPPDDGCKSEILTPREAEIMRLMTGGYSNREIAEALSLSEGTVKNHVSNILSKLHVRDRTRAVLKAIETGLV